ncbi:hypothetical protein LXL04_030234 [Taraxacum kok-saghyz]
MTSLADLNNSINLLIEKIEGLIIDIDAIVNKYVTTEELEVASAKIINTIIKELSEKIDSCPCNKEILENIKTISIVEQNAKPGKYSGLKRYSPPNPSIGNPELESQLLTTFTSPDGLFQWKVLPFGLKQAPSIFQRHMQNALRGFESFCTVYVDDIIVFSKNEQDHYVHVTQVKLKKDVIWNWTNTDTDYIKKIKKVLINFPKLYLPNIEDSLIIETDASDEFWGGDLKAKNSKNEEQICRYTSGSFKAAEKNYHSNEKELLAVKRVITKFSVYLTPVKFLVRTDNKNFTYFLGTKIAGDNKLGRLVRWQEWFSRYTFTVEHLAGNKNVLADCLTRDFSLIKETTTPLPNEKTSLLVNTNPCAEGISKMTILSPNNKTVQEMKPDYRKALDKAAERYYVIYQGPHAGIHTDWGTTEAFCKVDKVTCRKFPSEASAHLSIALHEEASKTKTPLLRPKIQIAKEDHRDQRFEVSQDIKHQVSHPPISLEDFREVWNKARAACPEDLIHERFYTTDRKTKSLYNFIEGADPKLVYQAYSAGLIDNIYLSCNLQELKFFPSSLVEAIKNFRRNVLKAKDDPIYIKIISSLPEWIHEATIPHITSWKLAYQKLKKTINEILSGSKKKVNYTTSHCIVVSWSFKNTGNEDLELASRFGAQFQKNSLEASSATRQSFCRHVDQLFEDHYCTYCESNNVKQETKEDPSTEDDKSSTS